MAHGRCQLTGCSLPLACHSSLGHLECKKCLLSEAPLLPQQPCSLGQPIPVPASGASLSAGKEQLMGRSSQRSNQKQVTPPQTQGTPIPVSPVARKGGKLLVGWSCPAVRGNSADSSVQKTAGISSTDRRTNQNKSYYRQTTDWPHLKR